eukprot:c8949_g1_i1.p1 GENE.c8949_g1_i1~~c8949_g1_i1.p1  ORF type:complete len:1050 (-),score=336.81 c8949_g1_i1:34-3078(-)
MADEEPVIDNEKTYKRISALYKLWKDQQGLFSDADALSLPFGSQIKVDENVYAKLTCVNQWLFGVLVVDLLMVVVNGEVHIVATSKKASLLAQLTNKKNDSFRIFIHERTKKPDNLQEIFDKLVDKLKKGGKRLGKISKEVGEGAVCGAWEERVKDSFEGVDVSAGLGKLLSLKDSTEQGTVTTSGSLSAACMNWFQSRMEKVLTDNQTITHEKISTEIEEKLKRAKTLKVQNVDADLCEPAFAPIVMSGSEFDLKLAATSNDKTLESGVIVCSVGVRYSSYCSNISRTFLIDPEQAVSQQYRLLLHAFAAGVQAIKPGTKCCDVYAAVKNHIQEKEPALVEHLLKSFGTGIGLEFKESFLQITTKCQNQLEAGMTLNLRVGLENLGSGSNKYALLIADTVLVTATGAQVLTDAADKRHHQVTYQEEKTDDSKGKDSDAIVSDSRPRRPREPDDNKPQDDELQRQLGDKLNDEARKRLLGLSQVNPEDTSRFGRDSITKIVSYQSVAQFPKACPANKIFVDMERECVLVPINSTLVPFHVATIKTVTKPEELTPGVNHYTLRINFVSPPSTEPWVTEVLKQERIFIKQLSFKSSNSNNLNTVFRQIKELRKRYTQEQTELKDKDDVVQQADLVLAQGGRPYARLRNVLMRPNLGGARKTIGDLQAHENGFRFQSDKGQRFDILFSNIKHAFFQPAQNDPIVLLHFHLKSPIMMARKKLQDIQFFEEVLEASAEVSGRNGPAYENQDDRRIVNDANRRFQEFCNAVDDKSLLGEGKEFDMPFHKLGFFGVAGKTTSLIQPTVNCLVDLMEWPTTIITLSEIEVVSFERVDFSIRNFDMAIVFKDYTKPVKVITSIAKEKLDSIKKWLSESRIKYYEGKINLQWNTIMKHILSDPEGFFNDGGWSFLDPHDSGSDTNSDSDSEAFEPPNDAASAGSASADSGSDFSDVTSESDDDASGDGGSDDESGMDWSDMEREAKRADAQKSDDDDEDKRPAKRPKVANERNRGPPPRRDPRR